jgi:hypothetical protein
VHNSGYQKKVHKTLTLKNCDESQDVRISHGR